MSNEPYQISRRAVLGLGSAGLAIGALSACSKGQAAAPPDPPPAASPSRTGPAQVGRPGDVPPLPAIPSFKDDQPLGAGMVTFQPGVHRDWSDIDRWYATKGRKRPAFTGGPRVHRMVASYKDPAAREKTIDAQLGHGMVLENQDAAPSGVYLVAHHNITAIRGGAVKVDGTVYNEPLMGIYCPEVPGDVFTWFLPQGGRTAVHEFVAVSVEIVEDVPGMYDRLMTPAKSGKPSLTTYQCYPSGLFSHRTVVHHEWTGSKWTNQVVEYV